MADLERSIQCYQQALKAMSTNNQDYRACLGHLGISFTFRYHRTGQITDLEQSIQYARQAIEATPAEHLDRGGLLAILANGFMEKFERGEKMVDIDQSIQYAQQAVEALLPDHPQRSRILIILGLAFAKRSERTASSAYFNNSTKAFLTVVSSSSGFPSIHITAGLYAVENYIEGNNWKEAAGTLDEIRQLLPEVAIPTNSRDDIQSTLRQLSRLASVSASIFLKAGRSPLEALQALEKA
jgi:tetratricopeptide (TPR) repeat protein